MKYYKFSIATKTNIDQCRDFSWDHLENKSGLINFLAGSLVFLKLNNVLGSKYYVYNYYPAQKFHVTAGVTYSF